MLIRRVSVLYGACSRLAHTKSRIYMGERLTPSQFLWNSIEGATINSIEDWGPLRIAMVMSDEGITNSNVDAMTVSVCTAKGKYELGLSYLDYLKHKDKPLNLATIGKYFKLLYMKNYRLNQTVDPEDADRIAFLHEDLKRDYPVVDAITLESVIQALSLTHKWEVTLEYLNDIKKTSQPTSRAYAAVISAAFKNDDDNLAWALINEVYERNVVIQGQIYAAYFEKHRSPLQVEEMLRFMEDRSLVLDDFSSNDFDDSLKLLNFHPKSTYANSSGVCNNCRNKLNTITLTESDFTQLKSKVYENIIIGKDVFRATTPKEVANFRKFLAKEEKFDVIIDGLNAGYAVGTKQPDLIKAALVASLVKYFAKREKKILVVGRNHMAGWSKKHWSFVQYNASTFLTQTLSQDDPYLLYCALNSGQDTVIVTRDMMRQHKFLLHDVRLRRVFNNWLKARQWRFVNHGQDGNPVFKKPPLCSHIVQKNNDHWHIPYTLKDCNDLNFLCVKIN